MNNFLLVNIMNERPFSAMSWEDFTENDVETNEWISEILDNIDNFIFGQLNEVSFPDDLLKECLIWKEKFSHGNIINNCSCKKFNTPHFNKSKSFSGPESLQNTVSFTYYRRWSDQFINSIISDNSNSIAFAQNFNAKLSDSNKIKKPISFKKPLHLPPIQSLSVKKNRQKTNDKLNLCKTFPLPPMVLSIDHLLSKS